MRDATSAAASTADEDTAVNILTASRAGQGRAGKDRAGQGKAGQGRARQGGA